MTNATEQTGIISSYQVAEAAIREFRKFAAVFPDKFFMALTSYADESGINKADVACIIAGWVADQDQWAKFCGEWRIGLLDKKAPYLHMRELSAYERAHKDKSPFHGWSDLKARDFVKHMIPVATSNA